MVTLLKQQGLGFRVSGLGFKDESELYIGPGKILIPLPSDLLPQDP